MKLSLLHKKTVRKALAARTKCCAFLEIFDQSGHASTDVQNFVLAADFETCKIFFLLPGSELLTTTNVCLAKKIADTKHA